MKKILLSMGLAAAFFGLGTGTSQAAELPEPTIRPNMDSYYFDGIYINWWKSENVPYTLSINPKYAESDDVVNEEGISLVKVYRDMTQEIPIAGISLVEFQEDDNSENYENATFQITLSDFVGLMEDDPIYVTFSLPADFLYVNIDGQSVPIPELTHSFTFDPSGKNYTVPEPEFTPEEGVISSLESVSIKWPNANGVLCLIKMFNEDKITATANGEEIDVTISYEWDDLENNGSDASQNGNIMIINLGKKYTTPGQVVIKIPSAIMWISDVDGGGSMDNPAYSFVYTIVAEPQAMAAPTINPADNTNVESLSSFTLTFTEGMVLSKNELQDDDEEVSAPEVTLTLDGEAIDGLTVNTSVSANVLTVTLNEAQSEPGAYVLNVPQGYVIYEDAEGYTYYNEAVNATYTILPSIKAPGVMPQPTKITPENSALVEVLSTITVSWDLPLQINEDNKTPIVLSLLSGDKTYNPQVSVKGNDLIMNFTDVAEGAYSLIIPAEYVIATEGDAAYYNPEVKLYYGVQVGETNDDEGGNTDGVKMVNMVPADGSVEIYNLQGVKVDANKLGKGIYIINGKKVRF